MLDVAVTADNSRFASVGGDRGVFLWDVEQGGTIRRWSGHNARVEAVQFAGEGDSVVVSGESPLLFPPISLYLRDGGVELVLTVLFVLYQAAQTQP